MPSTTRVRRARTALVGLSASLLLLTGCMPAPTPDPPCSMLLPVASCTQLLPDISSATFSQQQALPDFDDTEHVMTDPAELDRLLEILVDRGLPGDVTMTGDCDGGRTTVLEVTGTLTESTIVVDTCGDDPFAEDIDELVSEWRAMPDLTPAP